MKKIILLFFFLFSVFSFAQLKQVTWSVSPSTFEETTPITITINGNNLDESSWGVTDNSLYLWAWAFDTTDTTQKGTPDNGAWDNSSDASVFIYNAGADTYTKTITPTSYYNTTDIGKIGFLVKAKNGNGDKKSQDILVEVGSFQVTLTAPLQNSATIIASGSNFNIAATNTNGAASYTLKANGTTLNTIASTTN